MDWCIWAWPRLTQEGLTCLSDALTVDGKTFAFQLNLVQYFNICKSALVAGGSDAALHSLLSCMHTGQSSGASSSFANLPS